MAKKKYNRARPTGLNERQQAVVVRHQRNSEYRRRFKNATVEEKAKMWFVNYYGTTEEEFEFNKEEFMVTSQYRASVNHFAMLELAKLVSEAFGVFSTREVSE